MEIHYDLNGCHGTLASTERTDLPSLAGMLVLGAVLLLTGFAAFAFGFWGFVGVPAFAVLLLVGRSGKSSSRHLGNFSVEASEAEEPALSWVFSKRPVARAFRVEGHVLTFDAMSGERIVDLRGAAIRASDVGVYVEPTQGEPLELYWDHAIASDAQRLADALRNVRDRDLGSVSEVPQALQAARAQERG